MTKPELIVHQTEYLHFVPRQANKSCICIAIVGKNARNSRAFCCCYWSGYRSILIMTFSQSNPFRQIYIWPEWTGFVIELHLARLLVIRSIKYKYWNHDIKQNAWHLFGTFSLKKKISLTINKQEDKRIAYVHLHNFNWNVVKRKHVLHITDIILSMPQEGAIL